MEQLNDRALGRSAEIAVVQILKIKPGENALIVTNPNFDVFTISQYLYNALTEAGAFPVMVVQPRKSQLDFTEKAVLSAIASEPEVFISVSAGKLGRDRKGIADPYTFGTESYDHLFDYLLYGKKTVRAIWSPSVTLPIFSTTIDIDYEELKERCRLLKRLLDNAKSVSIQSPSGTKFTAGISGRLGIADDGDFSLPGTGGNLPAGEVFISPALGTASGTIVFDGSISSHKGEIIIKEPIYAEVTDGFVTDIVGESEAQQLTDSIRLAVERAQLFERQGSIPAGKGEIYAKNARNIGEIGIGLNPAAAITGNMLVDEKAFGTCHVAIGHNYDHDAPSLIHLDGLIKEPTIELVFEDGSKKVIMRQGKLL